MVMKNNIIAKMIILVMRNVTTVIKIVKQIVRFLIIIIMIVRIYIVIKIAVYANEDVKILIINLEIKDIIFVINNITVKKNVMKKVFAK